MVRTVLKSFVLILLCILSAGNAQQKMDLKGQVVDKDRKPVKDAQVKLLIANKSQTTDNDDGFVFFFEVTIIQKSMPDPV